MNEQSLLEELRASEARFRAICEAAPLGIYVSELGTGVVYVNPAMQQILGRTQEELLGTGWQSYLHPDDRARALAQRADRYEQSAPIRLSARYLRNDGGVIWTQLRAAPIREGDVLKGYVGMLEDITEHRALQAQLVMAGRLASVGTLAAGVAHEVNTPLAVMLGNLEWIDDRLSAAIDVLERPMTMAYGHAVSAAGATELARDLRALGAPLSDAREAAQRVRSIMRDLTLFSRPEADEQGAAQLQRVLASAARMASHELKHRARLVQDYGDAQHWVQGSEARLGQVFLNLLINAAHAIPEGSVDEHTVSLRVRRLADPEMVAVEVKDTGAGIEPGVVDHIFDPFFSTKPKSLGTGLGLAICHRIVSGLGGRIEVESEPGRGTSFCVSLRIAEPDQQANMTARSAAEPPRPRGRILLIDDDQPLLDSTSRLLSDEHEVRTTSSARDALDRLRAGERFDAILCDLMMPEMDGIAFHTKLSRDLPEIANKVIFLTGGAVTKVAREFLERVPNARLEKPFPMAVLQGLLAERMPR